jgi:hypothetical protein
MENENEPAPRELSPQGRYYADVQRKQDTPVDVWIAIEKLLGQLGVSSETLDSDALFQEIQSIDEISADSITKFEQYLLLPMRIAGPYAELAKTPQEITTWYEESVRYILFYTKNRHDLQCAEEADIDGIPKCINSDECPVVLAGRYLAADVVRTSDKPFDFADFRYLVDPKKTHDIAIAKIKVARNQQLVDSRYADAMTGNYQRQYKRFFGQTATVDEPESQS